MTPGAPAPRADGEADARFPPGLFAWYAPGFSDAIGDRLLLFDNTEGRPLELLRLCQPLAGAPNAELLLRARAHELAGLEGDRFARVCRVDRLPEPGGGLAVVSEHVEGQRLSEFLAVVHRRGGRLSADLALGVASRVLDAVASLHRRGPHLAHGALSPERLVVAPGGRVLVTEHVLGSVLQQVNLDRDTLWRMLRVALPPEPCAAVVDQRTDVLQVGLVAVSLLVGRGLAADDYPHAVPRLLDEAGRGALQAGWSQARWQELRDWLSRALCAGRGGFEDAVEAANALAPIAGQTGRDWDALADGPVANPPLPAGDEGVPLRLAAPRAEVRLERTWREALVGRPARFIASAAAVALIAAALYFAGRALTGSAPPPAPSAKTGGGPFTARAAGAGEGRPAVAPRSALEVRTDPSGARVLVDGQPRGVTPAVVSDLVPGEHEVRLDVAGRSTSHRVTLDAGRASTLFVPFPGADAPSAGWLTVVSAVELHVFEDDRLLGTSRTGRIMLPSGRHHLSLVNDAIGFRTTRDLQVPVGRTAAIEVALPSGRADINAAPWAEVWIDGEKAGDTPLAGFALQPGRHTVTFKHPRLGQRSIECFATLGETLRLSADLRKPPEAP